MIQSINNFLKRIQHPSDPDKTPETEVSFEAYQERMHLITRGLFLLILCAFILWLNTESETDILLYTLSASIVYTVAAYASVLVFGRPSHFRKALGVLTDTAALSSAIYVLGLQGAAVYPIFLWSIVGHGLRYGQRYLVFSAASSIIGFTAAAIFSTEWLRTSTTAASFVMGMVVLPLFYASLVRQLHEARSKLEEQVKEVSKAAYYDRLTGLPNRHLLESQLEKEIARAKRHSTLFSLMFLDLDGFKAINDTHGHAAGDIVLCEIAARLTGAIRETDTASRLGGDEFIILLTDIRDAETVRTIAEKLMKVVAEPIQVQGIPVSLQVTASIGVASYPEHGTEAGVLLRQADHAMYKVKRRGRNGFELG